MKQEHLLVLWESLGMETTCGECPYRNKEECEGYHEGQEVYEGDEVCEGRFNELAEGQ